MYLKDSNLCDACNNIDFIDHAFYYCRPVKEFWDNLSIIISTNLNMNIIITAPHALLGIPRGFLQICPPKKIKK